MTLLKIVFLDRDNTLIADPGYNCDPNQIHFMPGVVDGLQLLKNSGFQFVIITNQSGIGRGFYTTDDFRTFQTALHHRLNAEGIHVLADYFCPHLPTKNCECRKPKPGLFLQAFKDWPVDVAGSVMIGDRPKDVMAAAAAGIRGCFVPVETEKWPEDVTPMGPEFKTFKQAVEWVLNTK